MKCRNVKIFGLVVGAVWVLGVVGEVFAQDWDTVDWVRHDEYQAVDSNGSNAYPADDFPIRIRGVVLNNSEDWLNPTAEFHTRRWEFGGEAEIFVQAVDLPGDSWDDGDFGGTAAWMGQNYGNHLMKHDKYAPDAGDPEYSYSDVDWYDELDRLGLYRPYATSEEALTDDQLVRAGDLIEIRARTGLYYAGKMNVNEEHDNVPANDFEIVILQKNYGLPDAEEISLSDLMDDSGEFIFDDTRATGAERYQSTLIEIQQVRLAEESLANWGQNADLELVDATGRTLGIHLGLNESFATGDAPTGWFDVTGILNQVTDDELGDYYLIATNAASVPEPSTGVLLFALAAMAVFGRRWITRRS